MELETQQTYVEYIDEMVTYTTLIAPGAPNGDFLNGLRKKADITRSRIHTHVCSSSSLIDMMLNQATELSKIEATLRKKFDSKNGPFFSTLEKSLQELNVKRQAVEHLLETT